MRLLILLALWCSLAQGALIDHLKKAPNKSDNHSMLNIDFIYVINLDQRPEKWEMTLGQLSKYGIFPYRFSAVNGWELTLDQINDVGLKFSPEMEGGFMATSYHKKDNFKDSHEPLQVFGQTYFCHCMARGTIGIALSHISVLQDAYESGYNTIWVMEDDIEVIRDPRILSDFVKELDLLVGAENWDILFTDRDIRNADALYVPSNGVAKRPDYAAFSQKNNYKLCEDVLPHFRRLGSRFGAHSMIVRRSGMKKLLQFFKAHNIFLPYDMDYVLPAGIKLYTVLEDVVSNLPKAISDNGGANYLKKTQ